MKYNVLKDLTSLVVAPMHKTAWTLILLSLTTASSAQIAAVEPAKPVPPKGGTWLLENVYPAVARRHGWEGTVGFAVTVGADGLPKDCRIIATSGYPVLDEATCKEIMKRAKFNPATDATGKPIEGTFSQRMRWALSKKSVQIKAPDQTGK